MKVRQDCVIQLIENNGFICDYQDSFTEGVVTYHFFPHIVAFQTSCVSVEVAKLILMDFKIENTIEEIQHKECLC